MGSGKMLGGRNPSGENSSRPILIPLHEMDVESARIRFVYSAYNKCAVMDD